MRFFEIRRALREGFGRLKGLAGFVGFRIRTELALWNEMKEYEEMKERLNDLYRQLGKRFLEEAPPQMHEPFMEEIKKIRSLEEEIKRKEEEMDILVRQKV